MFQSKNLDKPQCLFWLFSSTSSPVVYMRWSNTKLKVGAAQTHTVIPKLWLTASAKSQRSKSKAMSTILLYMEGKYTYSSWFFNALSVQSVRIDAYRTNASNLHNYIYQLPVSAWQSTTQHCTIASSPGLTCVLQCSACNTEKTQVTVRPGDEASLPYNYDLLNTIVL